jgi:hypothetical protein
MPCTVRLDGVVIVGQPDASIRADEEGNQKDFLRRFAESFLQLTPREDVEFLIGAAKLDVRVNRNRIVRLQKWVQLWGLT